VVFVVTDELVVVTVVEAALLAVLVLAVDVAFAGIVSVG
jgi:hypothetical protein